jgi:hypothetical protein
MKPRAGLGKKVSSIFDGVPIPGATKETTAESSTTMSRGYIRDSAADAPASGLTPSLDAGRTSRPNPVRNKYGDISLRVQQQLFGAESGTVAGRQKAAAVAVVLLFVVLVIVVYYNFIVPASNVAAKPAAAPVESAAPSGHVVAAAGWKEPDPYPENLRDPMVIGAMSHVQPGANGGPNSAMLWVRGIIVSDQSSAIVNGQIVCEGDAVDGVTVVKIAQEYVEFKLKDKTWKQEIESNRR